MSWGNGAILSHEEVTKGAEKLPSEFQVGEPVGLWIEDGEKRIMLEGYIVAVGIMNMHKVRYDVAFRIADTPYYIVTKDARGSITHREATEPRHLVDDPTQVMPTKPRAALSIVPKSNPSEKTE